MKFGIVKLEILNFQFFQNAELTFFISLNLEIAINFKRWFRFLA